MGVLEIVIISLIVILFFTITGISGISRLFSWVIVSIEKVLFGNIIGDDDEKKEK
jgi:hypothetical protein